MKDSLGISERSHVPLACEHAKVRYKIYLSLPRAFFRALYFPATHGHKRDDIQSGECLMVELLRKEAEDLLKERNQLSCTKDLQGQAPIQCEKCVWQHHFLKKMGNPSERNQVAGFFSLCIWPHSDLLRLVCCLWRTEDPIHVVAESKVQAEGSSGSVSEHGHVAITGCMSHSLRSYVFVGMKGKPRCLSEGSALSLGSFFPVVPNKQRDWSWPCWMRQEVSEGRSCSRTRGCRKGSAILSLVQHGHFYQFHSCWWQINLKPLSVARLINPHPLAFHLSRRFAHKRHQPCAQSVRLPMWMQ